MTRHTASIVIDRSAVEVFYFMDDIAREPEWQPGLRVAEQDPPGPSKVGTRKRYVSRAFGREIANTYVVTEIDPGRRIVTETTPDSAIEARYEIVIEPEGISSRVLLTMDASPKGALKLTPARVLQKTYEKELRESLHRLKELIEGGG